MRLSMWFSAIALGAFAARIAHAEEAEESVDPQVEPLANAHASASVETSGGDGGTAIGVRALLSYDVLHGNGDTYRPALGLGLTLGGTGRDVEMSSKGILDVGGFVVASLRFHRTGVLIDRRVFASAGILHDVGPMTSQTGTRYAIGGNWFSAAAESHNAWLLLLPHQIEAYYQEQLGDHRYGVAIGYGF
jgi:hypothetical protein